jgi:hypothetical protein
MQEGFIPTSPISFEQALSKPVPPSAVATPLPKHRRRAPAPSLLPRRSSRLAKKAMHHTPSVAATQNVLMKKLGIFGEGHLQSSDFKRYLQMFKEGLTEWQVQLILELFKGGVGHARDLGGNRCGGVARSRMCHAM